VAGARPVIFGNSTGFKSMSITKIKLLDKSLKKGKVVGFAQLRNELSKGHLKNWFRSMGFCDFIYIFDQASDDGSLKEYAKHKNTVVIKSRTNRFKKEISCKSELLKKILREQPDTDWIFWMDGDTVLDNRLISNNFAGVKQLIVDANARGCGSISLGHYNLWRSNHHYRMDNAYHAMDGYGVVAFWKNNGSLAFPEGEGLHSLQFPDNMGEPEHASFKLVHYGFATDKNIIDKYNVYRSFGQSGESLERLLSEEGLHVIEADPAILPSFIDTSKCVHPRDQRPIREIYEEKIQKGLDDG
jgi:hypothetical protein